MAAAPVDTTDATFTAQVLNVQGPVVVHFWAEWSGPCQIVKPDFDALATTYAGRLSVVRHNIDQNPATPPKQNVTSIPTLIVYKKGVEVARRIGALSKGQLTEFVDANL
ncbi:thioredoxin family protein [Kitasatospora phosalacinea]|uniref:thioredoxin family protein n=1 Tax=Kitasatospora phosalacinea TaxID=2065 RepID=UPI0035E04028